LVAVVVISVVMLAAVLLLASRPGDTPTSTAMAAAALVPSSQNGPDGSTLAPIAVLFLAFGALAIAATVARSRNRGRAG
jgi:Tfp pilus assembly protein PilV